MTAHAVFAPSSAHRWLECPASAVLAADEPNRRSEAADEGTRVHKLVERAMRGEGMPAADDPGLYAVNLSLDYVRQLGPGSLFAEHRVTYNDDVWGTCDLAHVTPDETIVTLVDYKNGAYDVPVKNNKQMLSYGACKRRTYPMAQWYRFVIIQPNSKSAGDVEPVKQDVVSAAEVEAHAERIEDAVHRAKAGEAPRPGAHCRWCPAFGKCPATQSLLGFITEAVKFPADQVPDATMVRLLQVLKGFEDYRKLVDAELTKRMLAGRQVPGATLDTTVTRRAWKDDTLAAQALYQHYGAAGIRPVSPADADKLGAHGKALAKVGAVGSLAYKPPGQPKAKY